MALLAWPEDATGSCQVRKKSEHEERMVPGVKYECATPFIDGANVAIDKDGLLSLIKAGFLRDALYMTTKLLSNIGQGLGMTGRQSQNTQLSLEVWSCRFQLMMALRMHSQLLDELSAFGELDSSDLFLQHYPHFAGQKGTLVPFSLRLLHAEMPSFSPFPYSSIVRAHKLIEDTAKAIEIVRQNFAASETELGIWHERLEEAWMVKARVLFRLKAFEFYEWIISNSKSKERRTNVQKMLFWMAMHVGDGQKLVKYQAELSKNGIVAEEDIFPAFKAVFDGDYNDALDHLQKMKAQNPDESALDPKSCNNEAVCLLYCGKPVDCVQLLFNHRGPVAVPLALNVATVSDLVSTNSAALKQSFLDECTRNKPHNNLFEPAEVMRMHQ
uniref:ANK_REP_REGION domain-containing protein n=1 Tax=Globodera pallida TaxID=36090 RepID=A0A183CIN5_GLOPA